LTRLEVINFHLWLLWSTNWDPPPCVISSIRISFYAIWLFWGISINQNDFWYYRYVSQNCSVLHLFRSCLRIVLNLFHIFSHTKLCQICSVKCKTCPKHMNEDLSFLVINHTNDAHHWNSMHLSTSWLIGKIIPINELNVMLPYCCNRLYTYFLNLTGPKHMVNIKFKIIFFNMASYTHLYSKLFRWMSILFH
jgi:hypothetical protein